LLGPYIQRKMHEFLEVVLYTRCYEWFEFKLGIWAGLKMKLKLPVENEFYLHRHDADVANILCNNIKDGFKVIDIGAHIGYFSLLIAKIIGLENGKLFAIEPLPSNVERLKEHISCNGFDKNTKVLEFAASDKNGQEKFLELNYATIGKLAKADSVFSINCVREFSVETRSLDSLFEEGIIERPDFVKIDVEGAEFFVLSGMKDILMNNHPLLLVEIHNKKTLYEVWNFLNERGYVGHSINKGRLVVLLKEDLFKKPDDFVFKNFLFSYKG